MTFSSAKTTPYCSPGAPPELKNALCTHILPQIFKTLVRIPSHPLHLHHQRERFTTCKEDRPLFVQFCANDPDILLEAAKRVEPFCDYVDINLGCPQRIAKRGNYGAFLMDNLPVVKSLVKKLANSHAVPLSCKIHVFPKLEDTIEYARILEDAGCVLLAVHGRTRDQKDQRKVRADWKTIKAVREAVKIPVLANGNVRRMEDVHNLLKETCVEGILSAETLLENPAAL